MQTYQIHMYVHQVLQLKLNTSHVLWRVKIRDSAYSEEFHELDSYMSKDRLLGNQNKNTSIQAACCLLALLQRGAFFPKQESIAKISLPQSLLLLLILRGRLDWHAKAIFRS